VLGVRVIAGRDFTAADGAPNSPRVALIRYGFWKRRFGGDPSVAGRNLSLDGQPVTIAGVLPADFELPTLSSAEVLLSQGLGPNSFLRAYARLKPGVSARQAYAALQPLFQQMRDNAPAAFRKEVGFRLRSLHELQMGDIRRQSWLLLGAVGVLLLIACVNVTNLLLARLAVRRHEFTLRTALGAGKLRLALLSLTESTLLALAGGGIGLLLAAALLKIFIAMAPGGIPKIEQASLDARVLAVSFGVALAAGFAIGIWPAFTVTRFAALYGVRATGARGRLRFGLVSAQIALTVAMLGSASLLLRSLWNLAGVPLGFETDHVVTAQITLNAARYRTVEQQSAVFEQVLERAARIPGVQSAAVSDSLPPRGPMAAMIFSNIDVEGRPHERDGTGGMVPWRLVTPRYFETLGIPVVRGRAFTEADRHAAEPLLILNESLERMLFHGESVVGRRIRPGRGGVAWHTVVGIVKDTRDLGAAAQPEPQYYIVRRSSPEQARRSSFLTVRVSVPAAAAIPYLKQEVAAVDPLLPVSFETMEGRVSELSNRRRFVAWLVGLFAGFALLLAVAGIYGTASYLVTQRTREIGVRMALGATPAQISRQVLRETAGWTAAGAAGGILLASSAAQTMRSQFFGVTASDPLSWTASLAVLGLAITIAVLRPAIRAARVDPAISLREQ
jgi:predicted permease